ncbi:hypothetical protein NLI96_g11432 [Meripilus lineatus]|uniref:Flavin reductase like domain-containing protein n=1 Tax=Meripilus lineatus TaxID=2056292 RepID=A0AAD5Y8F8_9APHY|nr:hypothetical protein NLI96_g11432 [Physisporinus lineatus]
MWTRTQRCWHFLQSSTAITSGPSSHCRSISTTHPNFNSTKLNSSLPPFSPPTGFRLTQPPNPEWDLGQGLKPGSPLNDSWAEGMKQGWKTWSTENTPGRDTYKLLTSAVIPRPIAFVSTISEDGVPNLAPMSYFSVLSHDPPLLSVSLLLSPRKPKDTRENIKSTKEFTVNIISEPFVEAANACSVEAPARIDEWLVSGLTPEASTHVKPPRVKESAVGLECELYDFKDVAPPGAEKPTTTIVLGLIKYIHIHKAVLAEDGNTVDPSKLRPVARLGGATFARLGEGFDLSRLTWKSSKEQIEKLHSTQPENIPSR